MTKITINMSDNTIEVHSDQVLKSDQMLVSQMKNTGYIIPEDR